MAPWLPGTVLGLYLFYISNCLFIQSIEYWLSQIELNSPKFKLIFVESLWRVTYKVISQMVLFKWFLCKQFQAVSVIGAITFPRIILKAVDTLSKQSPQLICTIYFPTLSLLRLPFPKSFSVDQRENIDCFLRELPLRSHSMVIYNLFSFHKMRNSLRSWILPIIA